MSVQHNQHRLVPSERGLDVAVLAGDRLWGVEGPPPRSPEPGAQQR
jgi:hypothetical protein